MTNEENLRNALESIQKAVISASHWTGATKKDWFDIEHSTHGNDEALNSLARNLVRIDSYLTNITTHVASLEAELNTSAETIRDLEAPPGSRLNMAGVLHYRNPLMIDEEITPLNEVRGNA